MHGLYCSAKLSERLLHRRRRICRSDIKLCKNSRHQPRLAGYTLRQRQLRRVFSRQMRVHEPHGGFTASLSGGGVGAPCLAKLEDRAFDGALRRQAVLPWQHGK